MRNGYTKGTAVIWAFQWAFVIFLTAADCELLLFLFPLPPTVVSITVVMILRVYAMWNQSKRILFVLLFIFIPQVIVSCILAGPYDTDPYLSGMFQIIFTCFTPFSPRLPFISMTAIHLLSHNCPIYGFIFLQFLIEQHTIHC